MTWTETLQAVVIGLVVISVALFTWDRSRDPPSEQRSISQIFSNPYLRVLTILLMVLIVLRTEDGEGWGLPAVVVLIIGTTVAGADFILLLVALLKGQETFIKEHFALERERLKQLESAVDASAAAVRNREGRPDESRLRRYLARLPPARILWVDDHPEHNRLEIESLERAGLVVDTVRTNDEAAERVVGRRYNLVISDIARDMGQEKNKAGLELPKRLAPDRNRVPPILYYVGTAEGEETPDGYPVTDSPTELLRLIGDALLWNPGYMP